MGGVHGALRIHRKDDHLFQLMMISIINKFLLEQLVAVPFVRKGVRRDLVFHLRNIERNIAVIFDALPDLSDDADWQIIRNRLFEARGRPA